MMMEHFHKFARFGMILATILLPMITSDGGKTLDIDALCTDFNEGKNVDGSVFVSDESKNRLTIRLRDVVVDMVRLDYI